MDGIEIMTWIAACLFVLLGMGSFDGSGFEPEGDSHPRREGFGFKEEESSTDAAVPPPTG